MDAYSVGPMETYYQMMVNNKLHTAEDRCCASTPRGAAMAKVMGPYTTHLWGRRGRMGTDVEGGGGEKGG